MPQKYKHHRFTNKTGILTVLESESGGVYKSELEKDAFVRYLINPGARVIKMQEPCINYIDANGKKRRYTADVRVEWDNPALRARAIEVKYSRELTRHPELAEKFARVRDAFAAQSIEFVVLTEKEIRATGIAMMRFVFGYRNDPEAECEEQILASVGRNQGTTLGEVLDVVAGQNAFKRAIVGSSVWRLVAVHRLRVDFTQRLDETAKLALPSDILN